MRRRAFGGKIENSRELVEALVGIGQAYGISASQVALNWLVSYHGGMVVAIRARPEPSKRSRTAQRLDSR